MKKQISVGNSVPDVIKYRWLLEAATDVLRRHAKSGDDEMMSLANLIEDALQVSSPPRTSPAQPIPP